MSDGPETPSFRSDLVVRKNEDGGAIVYDAIFDRVTEIGPAQMDALRQGDAAVRAELEGRMVLDTPVARTVVDATFDGKLAAKPRPAPVDDVPEVDWSIASALPDDVVSEVWRDPERWRRAAHNRAAGNRLVRLDGFATPEVVEALRTELAAIDFDRLETDVVRARRHLVDVDADELAPWTRLMRSREMRTLCAAVLGVPTMPETIVLNAWHLAHGDTMSVHPDGKRYTGTLSLGLSHDWTAADGGAIAFGTPHGDDFDVDARWFPHAGDVLLFAPGVESWHCVEPVARRERLSLTGFWMM